MKILILHNAEGKEPARDILKRIKQFKVSSQNICLDDNWNGPESSLEEITADVRIIAVITEGVYASPWFAYFAGLCRGREQELIAYSGKKIAVSGIFEKTVIPLAGKKDLEKTLLKYIEEWITADKVREARAELLNTGIPFSGESFSDCVQKKNAVAVNLFLQAGFSANIRDRMGVPLLCLAARAGDKDIAKILLKAGSDVNALSSDRGGSALIDCALGKYRDLAALLLKTGADVNVKSKDGQSALIISVGLSDERFVEMLLKAGANADEPDALGASARKYAVLFNKPKIVGLFNKYAKK